jgi:hypothetical protein
MKGAPARAIQELAGHQNLSTTQRYMHLSPAALDSAIRQLDGPRPALAQWRHSGVRRENRPSLVDFLRKVVEAAGVVPVRRGRRPKPTCLATAPSADRAKRGMAAAAESNLTEV